MGNLKITHRRVAAISRLYLLILIILMVIPTGNANINDTFVLGFRGDHVVHCLVYMPWMIARSGISSKSINRYVWFIVGLVVVIGLEYIQMLLPYRAFNINDIVAGGVGLLLSLPLNMIYQKYKK